jgi:hypothetical protein
VGNLPLQPPPLSRRDLSARVDAALAFLAGQQRADGQFPSFRARDVAIVHEREYDSTYLATTYVLHALSYVDHPRVQKLAAPALDFLAAEMESHGVWRYWTSRHPRHDAIPPDLDDTCCASAALRRFGRPVPANQALILANRDRRGLFYTWILPRPARARPRAYWSVALRQLPIRRPRVYFWTRTDASPSDIDCVVNANVLHYLGDGSEARPVAGFLLRALEEGRAAACDKWHRNACVFYYAVSRACASGVKALESLREPLRVRIEAALTGVEQLASAEVALTVCALFNLEHRPANLEAVIGRLVAGQLDDGSWPAFALYSGGPPERNDCWGSRALTTSLGIEAIFRSMPNG